MCTHLYLALPVRSDLPAVAAMTERYKVGRGLDWRGQLDAWEGVLEHDEVLHLIRPWKGCHCGWDPSGLSELVAEILASGASSTVGVLAVEQGDEALFPNTNRERKNKITLERVVIPLDRLSDAYDENVIYITRTQRAPRTVSHRHGRRRRRTD